MQNIEYFNSTKTAYGERHFRPLYAEIDQTLSELCLTHKYLLSGEVSLATKIIFDSNCVYRDTVPDSPANALVNTLEHCPVTYSSDIINDAQLRAILRSLPVTEKNHLLLGLIQHKVNNIPDLSYLIPQDYEMLEWLGILLEEGAFRLPVHDDKNPQAHNEIIVAFHGTQKHRNTFMAVSILGVIIRFLNHHFKGLTYDFDKPCVDTDLEFWFAEQGLI